MDKLGKYTIGIDTVDTQHAKLLSIIGDIGILIKNADVYDRHDDILEIISALKTYTAEHFAHEESLMKEAKHEKRFTHKVKHTSFIREIESINLKEIDNGQMGCLIMLLDFISSWITTHIDKEDRKFALWCLENGKTAVIR